jgi:hypothetical protein
MITAEKLRLTNTIEVSKKEPHNIPLARNINSGTNGRLLNSSIVVRLVA